MLLQGHGHISCLLIFLSMDRYVWRCLKIFLNMHCLDKILDESWRDEHRVHQVVCTDIFLKCMPFVKYWTLLLVFPKKDWWRWCEVKFLLRHKSLDCIKECNMFFEYGLRFVFYWIILLFIISIFILYDGSPSGHQSIQQ